MLYEVITICRKLLFEQGNFLAVDVIRGAKYFLDSFIYLCFVGCVLSLQIVKLHVVEVNVVWSIIQTSK